VHGPSNICAHASSMPIETFAFVLTAERARDAKTVQAWV